jgi:hypothetical protein
MAGNPLKDGGFVIVNGLKVNTDGTISELDTPYPGGNLFSLASGGAVYIRDPLQKITAGQLNGSSFATLSTHDWELIFPYLLENEKHFDIPVQRLLEWDGQLLPFHRIYRKISPIHTAAIAAEEVWVKGK